MVDFLDFEGGDLYFDEPVTKEVDELLAQASLAGRDGRAEISLMRAYFLEPDHFTVLVALYRFFYYTQRYIEALMVADRVLELCGKRLGMIAEWQDITVNDMKRCVSVSMIMTRFYLFALKSSGFLLLRMRRITEALERLHKLSELDLSDQFGSGALIEIAAMANEYMTGETVRSGELAQA